MDIKELEPVPEEPRDRTKLVWGAILAAVAVMVVLMWFGHRPAPNVSSVRARHILVSYDTADPADRSRALDQISKIRERIVNGERFDKLAATFSEDGMSARRGGDLGWAPKGTYAPAFEEYCWSAEIGKLSEIISTSFGFHLIVVEDRHFTDAEAYEAELDRRARELEGTEKE